MANTDCPLYRLHLSTTRLQKDDSSIGKNKLNIKPSLSMTEGEKRLISWYPMVNEKYHPLPRQWSNNKNEKCSYLGLSENQMRVFYKGSLWILFHELEKTKTAYYYFIILFFVIIYFQNIQIIYLFIKKIFNSILE